MGKYDSRNMERRRNRKDKQIIRGNEELNKMLDIASKDITVNVIHDAPNTKKLDYVVLFTLKQALSPLEFQTLLYNKLRDLI